MVAIALTIEEFLKTDFSKEKQMKGPINQHKEMAMGKMPKASGNSGRTGFEKKSGNATAGNVRKSGTSTGSGRKR